MKTMRARFTRQDYLQLPEGFPAELIEGMLVKEPSPNYGHQGLVMDIVAILLRILPKEVILPGPVDAPINEYNVYIPDIAVFRTRPPEDEGGTIVPLVAFEIRSRRTGRRDLLIKTPKYLESGVEEVWIVNANTRTIEVHTRDGVQAATGGESVQSKAIPEFALVPDALFSPSA